MFLTDIRCMDPSTPHHIREWDVLATSRQNFRIFNSHFYNSHYEIYCAKIFLNRAIYTIKSASITSHDVYQIFPIFMNFSQLTIGR